jgi:hypothetical protein
MKYGKKTKKRRKKKTDKGKRKTPGQTRKPLPVVPLPAVWER